MECKVRWLQLQYHTLPMYIVIKKLKILFLVQKKTYKQHWPTWCYMFNLKFETKSISLYDGSEKWYYSR